MISLAVFLFALPLGVAKMGLDPIEKSKAYEPYANSSQEEYAKLIYIIDQFKGAAYKVIYDGHEYEMNVALRTAKNHLAKYYNNQRAEDWIRKKLYRSLGNGGIIYLKLPDGHLRLLRDVLMEQLKVLEGALKRNEIRLADFGLRPSEFKSQAPMYALTPPVYYWLDLFLPRIQSYPLQSFFIYYFASFVNLFA
jgi:hypothetical protein